MTLNLNELLLYIITGGIIGTFGQVMRMFVGLTKSYARDNELDTPRLIGSLVVGFTAGGIGIFSFTQWKSGAQLSQEQFYLLIGIGYSGTDFLEGIFRALISKNVTTEPTNQQIAQINEQIGETGKNIEKVVQQAFNDLKTTTNPNFQNQVTNFEPDIVFGPNAVSAVITPYVLGVIKDILKGAGEQNATITSTKRMPVQQATAMFRNLENMGIAKQRLLYGNLGNLIIDVYEQQKATGADKDTIIRAMTEKINELGPERISKHMGDFNKLAVIDIAPSSITNHPTFRNAVKKELESGRVRHAILDLDKDPAFHLEIPNLNTSISTAFVSSESEEDAC